MPKSIIVSQESVENKIYLIRGMKVMFDKDLAELYDVETKTLNRAVKRNIDRFPKDFMFQLSKKEYDDLRYQFGTSSWGGSRYLPNVFTEHGILMLANVLNSKFAIQISIVIVRTFARIRQLVDTHKEIAQIISQLERKYDHHDYQIQKLFDKTRDIPILPEKHIIIDGFNKKK